MKQAIGNVLFVLGWLATAWSAVVGLTFSGVYLMGFIGTSGREAGGELAGMLALTAVAVGVGLLIVKLGIRLKVPPA